MCRSTRQPATVVLAVPGPSFPTAACGLARRLFTTRSTAAGILPSTAGSWNLADGSRLPARLIDHSVPATRMYYSVELVEADCSSDWYGHVPAPTPTSPRQATSLSSPGPEPRNRTPIS